MRTTKALVVLSLALILLIPTVIATHNSEVSVFPQESMISTEEEMSLEVMNKQGDGITKVSLLIPENEQGPYFSVKEIASPAGWTYQVRYKLGQTYPYKITWLTEGTGIAEDKSQKFSFTVETPSTSGDYVWSWKTEDVSEDVISGSLTTSIISKKVTSFEIAEEPESIKAGKPFNISVIAKDNLGKVKKDYTGTIHFESTDSKALLPEKYNFTSEDNGSKMFEIELRTSGNQTFSVFDKERNISSVSDRISVELAEITSLSILPKEVEAEPNETISFQSLLTDVFRNKIDVTSQATFSVEERAGGTLVNNTYTTENEGLWVVKASYRDLTTGTLLEVVETKPEVNETTNVTETNETVTNETQKRMKLVYPGSIEVEPGKEVAFNVTVENTGEGNLSGVELVFQGPIPQENVEVLPKTSDIGFNDFQKYSVVVSIPKNTTGSLIMPFSANSTEGAIANGTLLMSVSETGVTPSKPDYSEIIVLVVIGLALIISGYTFLRRKKKEEKPSQKTEE